MRRKYEQFYSVTDEKFNKGEFEKMVTEENRLITKGIEVGTYILFWRQIFKSNGRCRLIYQEVKKILLKWAHMELVYLD